MSQNPGAYNTDDMNHVPTSEPETRVKACNTCYMKDAPTSELETCIKCNRASNWRPVGYRKEEETHEAMTKLSQLEKTCDTCLRIAGQAEACKTCVEGSRWIPLSSSIVKLEPGESIHEAAASLKPRREIAFIEQLIDNTPEPNEALKKASVAFVEAMHEASTRQEGGQHYKELGVEPWDVTDTWPVEQQIGYHRGNALKYIMRLGKKDARLQEVKKALHYCEKLVEVLTALEAKENSNGN